MVVPKQQESILSRFKQEYQKLPLEVESENISKILSEDLYKSVAKIVGLDENIKEKIAEAKRKEYKRLYKGIRHLSRAIQPATLEKEPSEEYYEGSSVEPPSPRIKDDAANKNPYFMFLQKSEREQVTWTSKYLPPETETEKGLVKRADDLTNKICSDFSTYMENLGGYNSPLFKKETVKELFQIEFDTHASKSLLVDPKILPCVTEQISESLKLPQMAQSKTINKHIKSDIEAENKQKCTVAFNKKLPKFRQWRPPKNNTKNTWMVDDKLPKEITTMGNVWDGIIKLKSVQDFCHWLIENPHSTPPHYLKKTGMLDRRSLNRTCMKYKYDKVNALVKLDVETLLSRQDARKMSVPPDDIKMVDFRNICI